MYMSENSEIWEKTKDNHPAANVNSECAARWVIHCICCEVPVEPWQTNGYEFGYCANCFDILMEPPEKS